MRDKILKLVQGEKVDDECVDVARALYEKCKSGEYAAFVAIAIDENDSIELFIGNSEKNRKNMLQLLGAIWMLNHYAYSTMDKLAED